MREILTFFGTVLIFSCAHAQVKAPLVASDSQAQTLESTYIVPPRIKVIDAKSKSELVKRILNKDLSQLPKLLTPDGNKQSFGGATSGGGDDLGLEVQRILSSVAQMIEADNEIYELKNKHALLSKAAQAKIIITDEALPAESKGVTQYSTAFSVFDGQLAVILIQRQKWTDITSPVVKDTLIHHELAVLAGLETTGDYLYSDLFSKRRAKFWEQYKSRKFVCTFNLFASAKIPGDLEFLVARGGPLVGKLVGSAAAVNNVVGAKNGWDVLYDLTPPIGGKPNKAVIVRYVISNNGFLRAEFSEGDVQSDKSSDWKIFSNLSKNSQARVYFSPYDLIDSGREATFETWENFFVQVACSKL